MEIYGDIIKSNNTTEGFMEQSNLDDNSKKIKVELRSHIAQSLLRYLLICAFLTVAMLFNGYQISTNYILIALIPVIYFLISLIFPPVKQYNPLALQSLSFSFKWLNILCALIAVFIIVSGTALISYNSGYSSGNTEDTKILGQSVNNGAEGVLINTANNVQKEMQVEVDFFNKYAVIVLVNGTNYYHKYGGCDVIKTALSKGASFYIFNTETAKSYEYEPCPNCFK